MNLRLRLLMEVARRENLDLPSNKSAITHGWRPAVSPRTAARHWKVLDEMKEEGLLWTSPFPSRYKELAYFHLTPAGEMAVRMARSSTSTYGNAEN